MPLEIAGNIATPCYARFNNAANTAINFGEGSGLKKGIYTIDDATIAGAGIVAGTYLVRAFTGTAAAQAEGDFLLAVLPFRFNGTVEIPPLIDLAAIMGVLMTAEGIAGRMA